MTAEVWENHPHKAGFQSFSSDLIQDRKEKNHFSSSHVEAICLHSFKWSYSNPSVTKIKEQPNSQVREKKAPDLPNIHEHNDPYPISSTK